jgi:A118 family predicted phage portal protein
MLIRDNMAWPPKGFLSHKVDEYSAWYSGDPDILSTFYSLSKQTHPLATPSSVKTFWGMQSQSTDTVPIHVPIASDIASTSSDLLFSEAPTVEIIGKNKSLQESLDMLLEKSFFFRKLHEGGEICAALGGVFIKQSWDSELSEYPIPVIIQPDRAIPTFKFGILESVIFWKTLNQLEDATNKRYRLLEEYSKGKIESSLYVGSEDKLGIKVDLNSHPETEGIEELIQFDGPILAEYIPNMLPNRLDRGSYLGRSDLQSLEPLMDSLDQLYTAWGETIELAKPRVLVPESFLKTLDDGNKRFNSQQKIYVKLDVDPVSSSNSLITMQQFKIEAEQFERSALNLFERIITSAGYSPQTFGLGIEGRAESGTALAMREKKSFSTKSKKERYWEPAIISIINQMAFVWTKMLGGDNVMDHDISVSFSDSITQTLSETSTAIKMLHDAMSTSIETRVKMLHPEWSEVEIINEIKRIKEEYGMGSGLEDLDDLDDAQMEELIQKKLAMQGSSENSKDDDTEE